MEARHRRAPPIQPFDPLTGLAAMSLKRKAAGAEADVSKKPKTNGSITAFFGAPKSNPNSPAKSSVAARFDKDAWAASLTAEQKELLHLELNTLHESWLPHLKDVLVNPQFLELKRFLNNERASGKTVYPPMEDVYSWYHRPVYCSAKRTHHERTGPGTRRSTQSRSSSQAKTLTTVPDKPTGFASPSVRLHPLLPLSRISTKRSKKTTPTTSPRPTKVAS